MYTLAVLSLVVAVATALPTSSQFHSQGPLGGYSYGYVEPNGAKTESKTPEGIVTGSYSYVAPNGQVLQNNYVADAHGFRSNLAPTAEKDFSIPAAGYAKAFAAPVHHAAPVVAAAPAHHAAPVVAAAPAPYVAPVVAKSYDVAPYVPAPIVAKTYEATPYAAYSAPVARSADFGFPYGFGFYNGYGSYGFPAAYGRYGYGYAQAAPVVAY